MTLADQFTRELDALAGVVHRVPVPTEALPALRRWLDERQVTRVLAWDDRCVGDGGLIEGLRRSGISIEDGHLPADAAGRAARLAALDDVPVGVTGALAGLADTGSLVLVSGPGRGRLASLLPPVHLAVLRERDLYPDLEAFLTAHPDVSDLGSNLVVVTGPSRTADIEMTLSRGVHGPKEVHVMLVAT